MRTDDVVEILGCLRDVNVRAWVDGGWGVDALVATQTRDHGDLDLALDVQDLQQARRTLEGAGFRHDRGASPRLPAGLVLIDALGRQVDVHPLHFDAEGNGWLLSAPIRTVLCVTAGRLSPGHALGTDAHGLPELVGDGIPEISGPTLASLSAQASYVIHEGPGVVKRPFDVFDFRSGRLVAVRHGSPWLIGVWGFAPGLVACLPGELGGVKRRVVRAWVIGAGCGRLTRVSSSGREG